VKTLSAYVSDGVRRLPRPHAAFGVSLIAYKTAADVASKTVTLVVTVAAARALSQADFGVMALAMTTGWLLGVASDAGLPMFAATRVAHAHAAGLPTHPIAREITRWRIGLALAAVACAGALALVLVPAAAALAFTLIVLHQLLGAMLDTVAHIYRGLGRTDIESTISLAHRGLVAFAALTTLAVHPTLLALSLALAMPPLFALILSTMMARQVTTGGPSFILSRKVFAAHVMPLGLGVLLSALYFRIDVYFLDRFHGVEVVGFYNAAFRVVDALRLFPAAGLAVAYPLLCAATDFRRVRQVCALLAAASLIVATSVYVAAGPLLTLVYGETFARAGRPLQVLSLSIPFFFVNYALTHQLIAWDRERAYLAIAAAALAANVALNAWLIPSGEMVGAAYSTLITEGVVCAGCLVALRRR
jgi:O-antigen/teichoic acid export membrane protein